MLHCVILCVIPIINFRNGHSNLHNCDYSWFIKWFSCLASRGRGECCRQGTRRSQPLGLPVKRCFFHFNLSLNTVLFIWPEYVIGSATLLPEGFSQTPQQLWSTTASSGLYLPGRRVSVHAHTLTHTVGTVYQSQCIFYQRHSQRLISTILCFMPFKSYYAGFSRK